MNRLESTQDTLSKTAEVMELERMPSEAIAIGTLIPIIGEIALSLAAIADAIMEKVTE